MNFTLCKTSRIPGGKRPVHLRTLPELLNDLGVEAKERYRSQLTHENSKDFAALWDKFDAAKAVHRERVKALHPDRFGSHAECATVNSIWTALKARFAMKGIGIHV